MSARFLVQVPATLHYAGQYVWPLWADLPPVEGHARLRDALHQADTTPGRWRIVRAENRTLIVVSESIDERVPA